MLSIVNDPEVNSPSDASVDPNDDNAPLGLGTPGPTREELKYVLLITGLSVAKPAESIAVVPTNDPLKFRNFISIT